MKRKLQMLKGTREFAKNSGKSTLASEMLAKMIDLEEKLIGHCDDDSKAKEKQCD